MDQRTLKKFFQFFTLIILTLGLSISFQSLLAAAWQSPTNPPASPNVPPPINTGTIYQARAGDLGLGQKLTVGGDVSVQGNVSIGVNATTKKLDVQGASSFGAGAYQTSAIVDVGNAGNDYPGNSGWGTNAFNTNILLSGTDNTTITFHDAGTSVGALGHKGSNFYIDGAGSWGSVSLGINTRAPESVLDVLGLNNTGNLKVRSGNGQIQFYNWSDSINYIESTNGAGNASQLLRFTGVWGTAGTFSFEGKVGIGTANPDSMLTVYGSNQVLNLQNNATAAGSGGTLRFGHDQAGSKLPVAEIRSYLTSGAGVGSRAGDLTFLTSSAGSLSERMRILSSGNVGIRTQSPSQALDVNGQIKTDSEGAYGQGVICGQNGTQCLNFRNDGWLRLSDTSLGVYGSQGLAAGKLYSAGTIFLEGNDIDTDTNGWPDYADSAPLAAPSGCGWYTVKNPTWNTMAVDGYTYTAVCPSGWYQAGMSFMYLSGGVANTYQIKCCH